MALVLSSGALGAHRPDDDADLGKGRRLIVVAALLAHGLWLFNDGVFYDAWLEWAAGTYGKWEMLQGWFDDSGMPQVGWLHRVLMRSPAPQLTYALLSVACWTGVGLKARTIAARCGASGPDATLAGMLIVTSRFGCTGISFIHAPYFMALFALVFAGDRLMADARAPRAGRPLLLDHVALWISLFFMSMMPSSFAAFYVFLFTAICCDIGRKDRLRSLLRRADLIVLPIAIFVANRALFPTKNGYAGNNDFRWDDRLWKMAINNMDTAFDAAGRQALRAPLALLAVGAVVAVVLVARGERRADPRRTLFGLLFATGWLVAALLPYSLVNKCAQPVRIFTWRHGLLLFLVPPLIYVAVSFVARRWRPLRVLWAAAAGVLIAGQAFSAATIHAEWLSCAVKQRAVVEQARSQRSTTSPPEVVWLDDKVPNPRYARTGTYELTGLVSAALGSLHAGGLLAEMKDNVDAFRIEYFWYYLLPEFRGDGPHATLTLTPLRPMRRADLASIGLGYAFARLRWQGVAYANSVVDVSLTPTEPPANWAAKLAEAAAARRAKGEASPEVEPTDPASPPAP